MKTELKTLDLKAENFTANGKNYRILTHIPLSRWQAFRKLQVRLVYGMDSKTLGDNLMKAYNFCNRSKPEPVSAGIILHNIMNGLKDLFEGERFDIALEICALIIMQEGEDIGTYDQKLDAEKIKDWEKEGFEPSGFFQLALNSIPAFKTTLDGITSLINGTVE